jgi:hypothetical protein
MPVAAMAEEVTSESSEPGAPIPRDQIDPELVKLSRPRPRIGVVTAAGVVFLCAYFLWKLGPDRHFAGEPSEPRNVTVADVVAGKVADDSYIAVDAEPLMAHTIRSSVKPGALGLRVVPARGSAEKLWIVLPGDGWGEPNTKGYTGRVRELADLPMAESIAAFLAKNPRPMFATIDAVRAGLASGTVTTVAGDKLGVRDGDRVAYDVVDPTAATVLCTYTAVQPESHPDVKGEPVAPPVAPPAATGETMGVANCSKALSDAGLAVSGAPAVGRQQAKFMITGPDAVATARKKLEEAKLWGTTVEPVTQHFETTWGKLKEPGQLAAPQLDLLGIYVTRGIPDGALVLLTGEQPAELWYVLPVTIVVGLIGLLFLWAFVRAIKRDLLA